MSDKYIIKNCPAIYRSGTCGVKNQIKCTDCTDCVIKQIYNLCNKYKDTDIIALHVTMLLQIEEDK